MQGFLEQVPAVRWVGDGAKMEQTLSVDLYIYKSYFFICLFFNCIYGFEVTRRKKGRGNGLKTPVSFSLKGGAFGDAIGDKPPSFSDWVVG
ncbi:hypothetical protein KZX66_17400 [Pseudomonas sp. EYE_354]|nr:hypothetical protein [Pseudomonas sp. EYE_354]